MIWVAGRSPTLVSQNLKATTLTYLAIAKRGAAIWLRIPRLRFCLYMMRLWMLLELTGVGFPVIRTGNGYPPLCQSIEQLPQSLTIAKRGVAIHGLLPVHESSSMTIACVLQAFISFPYP
jgi:hypothetical protein